MVENLEKKEEADKKTFKETQNLYSLSLSRSREDVLISNNNVEIEKNLNNELRKQISKYQDQLEEQKQKNIALEKKGTIFFGNEGKKVKSWKSEIESENDSEISSSDEIETKKNKIQKEAISRSFDTKKKKEQMFYFKL